jgi:saccharopine dehydrogenase-like NADP-dependent oxidoreductase
MRKRAAVLGCGLIGATMSRELADDDQYEVIALDAAPQNLQRLASIPRLTPKQVDLSKPADLQAAISAADVVVGALPSKMGFATLETVIRAGKPYCDISFMPQDVLALDALAKEHGVTAVVDCGVSPGLSNMMVAYGAGLLDRADRAEIYVGGLPRQRTWPYQYKAPFAPSDVIEEYTRPARFRENGKLVVRPALSEPELMDFAGVGTLEAFNTDGLRSLLATLDIPNMKEKTLRYPGHIELMRVLRETGFFGEEAIHVRGVSVRPLDVTSALLFPKWKPDAAESEFTVLRVFVEGAKNGRGTRVQFDLFDENDPVRGMSSMARTTGFPCVIVAKMLAEGRISSHGVLPPELIARQPGVFEHVVAELGSRNVRITQTQAEPRP